MFDREEFLENIKKQYADSINSAYFECEHEKGEVDFASLRMKIEKMEKAAKMEGLKPHDYHELVCCVLPHDIVENLFPEQFLSKAA